MQRFLLVDNDMVQGASLQKWNSFSSTVPCYCCYFMTLSCFLIILPALTGRCSVVSLLANLKKIEIAKAMQAEAVSVRFFLFLSLSSAQVYAFTGQQYLRNCQEKSYLAEFPGESLLIHHTRRCHTVYNSELQKIYKFHSYSSVITK